MMLVGKVPIDFIRHKVELEKPADLKMSDVKSILSSSINFEESAKTQASLIARQPSVQAAANRNECGHCRDVAKKPYPKYIHPAERCYTLHPHLFEEDKKKREKERERREKDRPKKPVAETAAVAKEQCPAQSANVAMGEEIETCYISTDIRTVNGEWIIDSGCTTSMVPDAHLLDNYVADRGQYITVGNGARLPVRCIGSYSFTGVDGQRYRMERVFHVPDVTACLLSVRAFTGKGACFSATGDTCSIARKAGGIPFIVGSSKNGLYRCHLAQRQCTSFSSETSFVADSSLIHRRFGHVSLAKSKGLPDVRVTDCDACIRGKVRRMPFNRNPPLTDEPLAVIHADLWVTNQATESGAMYMAVFTCSATKYTTIYLLKRKSEATQRFIDFASAMTTQTAYTVKHLVTDGGGEFDNGDMKEYCRRKGIGHRTTIAYSSNQNGKAERRIGIIVANVRTLLIDAGLRASHWGSAAKHAVYIRNRLPDAEGKTPHQRVFGRIPRTDHLRPYGCAAYIWIPPTHRPDRKLNVRAMPAIFVGFEEGTRNAVLFEPSKRKYYRSRDVRYLEIVFPAKGDRPADLSFLEDQWENDVAEMDPASEGKSKTVGAKDDDDMLPVEPV